MVQSSGEFGSGLSLDDDLGRFNLLFEIKKNISSCRSNKFIWRSSLPQSQAGDFEVSDISIILIPINLKSDSKCWTQDSSISRQAFDNNMIIVQLVQKILFKI